MSHNIILIPTKIEAELVPEIKGIFISGIAKRTTRTLKSVHEKYPVSKAVLIGFAGKLDDRLGMNCTYNVTEVTDGERSLGLSPINKKWESTSLITVIKPVHTMNRKLELARSAALVDMESFYFAEYCIDNDITPYIIRVVSDSCDKKIKDFFVPGAFKETKSELAKAVKTIGPLLSL
jgi:nucleoside phosphorylase